MHYIYNVSVNVYAYATNSYRLGGLNDSFNRQLSVHLMKETFLLCLVMLLPLLYTVAFSWLRLVSFHVY